LGSLIALIALGIALYYLDIRFPELRILEDVKILIAIFGGVFILGVLISWISTYFATQRFLNLRTDDLYY